MATVDDALSVLKRMRSRSPSIRSQRIILAIAAVVFGVAAWFAWGALPEIESGRVWWILVVIGLIGAPANLFMNAEEFHAIGMLVDVPLGWYRRIRVSVISAAANLLPVPGSLVVRGRDLHRSGATLGAIGTASAVAGVAWAGANGLLAGIGLVTTSDEVELGVLASVGGAAIWAGLAFWYRRRSPDKLRALGYTYFIEAASVFIGGIRLYAVIRWLGYDVNFGQALALAAAGLAIAAAGFVPSGLGVRELSSVAIGPLVGLPASVSFAAAAVSRVIDLVALAPLSIALLFNRDELAPIEGDEDGAEAAEVVTD